MASGATTLGKEPFRLGINMAGAISAGAYTAGVLDFLTEALDEWYAAKARGEAVPAHDVMIEVFSGASAGGMCAAISAVMLQQNFDHIHQTTTANGVPVTGTTNRFYESWVNQIDICRLLQTEDLKTAPPVVSLLDCSVIDEIAEYALAPVEPLPPPRPYVSPTLTLFLSLTNLRGVPYSLNDAAPGSIEESASFYADRIRFETVRGGAPSAASAHGVDITTPGAAGGWDLLQTAAKATGAFPVFLAPRILPRGFDEYCPAGWESVVPVTPGGPAVKPAFPTDLTDPFSTLNVDGGVTNNDPFNYAHDYLASLGTPSPDNRNPRSPQEANRAVLSVAPFPTTQAYASKFDTVHSRSIFYALPRLFSALIAQSRFFGESLSELMGGDTFSRFVIAPSDDANDQARKAAGKPPQPALQCASLGAFGGFFERGFRAHDFMLGRRNCQKFLYDYFLLPIDNPIIADGLARLSPEQRAAVLGRYARPEPGDFAGAPKPGARPVAWLPILPLCSPKVAEMMTEAIPRVRITKAKLKGIVKLVLGRFRGLASVGIGHIPSIRLRAFLRPGPFVISWFAGEGLRTALIKQLGDDYQA